MPYEIQDKLVVSVASSALFDLTESDAIFEKQGQEAYREYQRKHEDDVLVPGVAFPFIRRLLSLNKGLEGNPVEVILLSRNDCDTGLRVMNSIESHGLDISRGMFLSGGEPYKYVPAFFCSLFLSANAQDVKMAILSGSPAGMVMKSDFVDDFSDEELRIAFDFDGVLADDESERVFQETKDLQQYHSSEREKATIPLNPGPLKDLLQNVANLQHLEREKAKADPAYKPRVKTAIITARNAPAHERLVHTLRAWGITVDATFMLGGIDKSRIISTFQPHIFFDDQKVHLDTASGLVPSVHVPFGVANDPEEVSG